MPFNRDKPPLERRCDDGKHRRGFFLLNRLLWPGKRQRRSFAATRRHRLWSEAPAGGACRLDVSAAQAIQPISDPMIPATRD
jgi:hypothetical protein